MLNFGRFNPHKSGGLSLKSNLLIVFGCRYYSQLFFFLLQEISWARSFSDWSSYERESKWWLWASLAVSEEGGREGGRKGRREGSEWERKGQDQSWFYSRGRGPPARRTTELNHWINNTWADLSGADPHGVIRLEKEEMGWELKENMMRSLVNVRGTGFHFFVAFWRSFAPSVCLLVGFESHWCCHFLVSLPQHKPVA